MPDQSRNTAPAAKKPKSKEEEIVVLDMQKVLEGEPEECECDKTKSVHSICAMHRVMRMIPLCTKQVRCTKCVRAVEEHTGRIGEPERVSNHIVHHVAPISTNKGLLGTTNRKSTTRPRCSSPLKRCEEITGRRSSL